MNRKIAVLLTCYNRKEKTRLCLSSFYKYISSEVSYDIYMVDDGSTDGTNDAIKEDFPLVNIIKGNGYLFWAGGMRLAWQTAIDSKETYDGFLLVNDDVEFLPDFWSRINEADLYAINRYAKRGLYSSGTKSKVTGEYTYGGSILQKHPFRHRYDSVLPVEYPQKCDLVNANILYVTDTVFDSIGMFDNRFTHGGADYDYGLSANKAGLPVLLCPHWGGFCENDHPNVPNNRSTLKKRIENLYSIKGFALNEYLYYLNKHFRFKAPYSFVVSWIKVLFPNFINKSLL